MKKQIKNRLRRVGTVAAAIAAATSIVGSLGVTAFANIADGLDTNKKYSSDYSSMDEVLEAGAAHNIKLAQEGYTLLKNRNNALPLTSGARKVTVLGATSDSIATTGAGSGAQSRPSLSTATRTAAQLFAGFEAAGIEVNPAMQAAYASTALAPNSFSIAGAGGGRLTQYYDGHHYMDVVDEATDASVSFGGKHYVAAQSSDLSTVNVTVGGEEIAAESMNSEYDDAAIVVITRNGTEGSDNPARAVAGHSDETDHFLMLSDGEKELMAYAIANFDKVVVILNSPAVMELGDLENNDGISAILCIGLPGWNGADAVGGLLTGEVNPSARTVDIYMNDLKKDPSWYNFGNYQQVSTEGSVANDAMPMGHAGVATGSENFVDYAEGIYMGYRYYETVAADLGDNGEQWYADNVVYPFGYGLSYTTFDQKIKSVTGELTAANKDGEIAVTVTVTNTGNVAGKEVVQLYSTAPYTAGGIEKAAKDLVGFTKTPELAPGASADVTVKIKVKDLAAFDYDDANENEHDGYELEAGGYTLTLGKNSHEAFDSQALTAAETILWDEDDDATTPNNIYSQPKDSQWGEYNTLAHTWTATGEDHYLSREDLVYRGEHAWDDIVDKLSWAFDSQQNQFTDQAFAILNTRSAGHPYEDYDDAKTEAVETDYINLWTKSEADIPDSWTQAANADGRVNGMAEIQLYEMLGLDYDDARWDDFLNQLTWREMTTVVSNGNFQIPAISAVGLPQMRDSDGPVQLKSSGSRNGWAWVSATVVASTWNTELAEEQGNIVGEESIWLGSNGWYGPAMNTHRNPLAGRNFEYYSQDGLQGGKIAAAVVKGATDKGCHVYIKHFYMNDQETGREGLVMFATEQAIRQLYARPFEIAIREGNANGVMNSFNLIGLSTSVGYATVQQMLYNEWGFDGFSVTDYWITDYARICGWSGWHMTRGLTAPLAGFGANSGQFAIEGTWDATARDGKGMVTAPNGPNASAEGYDANAATPTQWYWTRETVHRLMYTVVNGNGMRNGLSSTMLASGAVQLPYNQKIAGGISLADTAALDSAFGGSANYRITVTGNLPDGVVFNSFDHTLIGTPAERGAFNITVTATGIGNGAFLGSVSSTVSLRVAEVDFGWNVVIAGSASTVQIEQYAVELISEGTGRNYFPGQAASRTTYNNGNGYVGISYAADGLPEGLTLDTATGAITGTIAEAGTHDVTVTVTLQHVVRYVNGWSYAYRTEDLVYTAELTLQAIAAPDTSLTLIYASVNADGDLIFMYSDGSTRNLGRVLGTSGTDGLPGMDGTNGVNGADGVPGAPGEAGAVGATGNGIKSITKVGTEGLVDTYRITFNDETTFDFTVTNGANGTNGVNGSDGTNGTDGAHGVGGSSAAGIAGAVLGGISLALVIAGGALYFIKRKKA